MKARDKEAVLAIVAGLLVLYFIYDLKVLLWIALVISLAAIISDTFTSYISKGWYGLAAILGFITNKIILSVIFYLLLTPIALLKKLTSKRNLNKTGNSFYTERNHTVIPEDFNKQW